MVNYDNATRETRLAIAKDERTSPDLLAQLALDEYAEIRQAVASNPSTPPAILLKLGQELPEQVVANPIFTILRLENPESQFARLSLARSSTTPVEILENLAQLPDEEILCATALNPNTPVAILEQFVQNPPQIYDYEDPDGTEFERLFACVAKNPNTPESILIQLVNRAGSSVNYALAENPHTPVGILEKFAQWKNLTMHQALVRNPNAPTAVLEKLAGEQSQEIRNLVKAHPHASEMAVAIAMFMEDKYTAPIHLLEQFATHSSPHVRRLVAARSDTPSHVLELLVLDSEEDLPLQIAEHRNASATVLECVTQWLVKKYQKAASIPALRSYQAAAATFIKRSNYTSATLEMLFAIADINFLHEIARQGTTPPDVLLKLTQYERQYPNCNLRENLARNPHTPTAALETMLSTLDKEQYSDQVYLALVAHPNIPVQLLAEFATHPRLRTAVSQNPNAPSELLRQLANEPKAIPLYYIAKHQNTPVDLLLDFVTSPDVDVRRGLARNIKAPISVLQQLANDENVSVRMDLAQNPHLPVPILERLANDPEEIVCKSLLRNPQTPTKIVKMVYQRL